MSIDTNFTPPPFTESPVRATTAEGANLFQNQAKQLFDWILNKFKVDDTDTNTFANFIKSANETVTSVNTAQEAINATVGNREIKTSWNETDDFQNKIVKHNGVLWACATTTSCVNSEPTDTNADWIQLTFLVPKAPTVFTDRNQYYRTASIDFLDNNYTPTKTGQILVEVTANVSAGYYGRAVKLNILKDGVAVADSEFYSRYFAGSSSYARYMMHTYTFSTVIDVTEGVTINLKVNSNSGNSENCINCVYNGTSQAHGTSIMKVTEL